MLLALAIVVVLVVVIVVLVVARRPGKGDLGSVQRYHTAVSTLEHMPDRVGRAPLRIVEPAGPPPGTEGEARPRSGPDAGIEVLGPEYPATEAPAGPGAIPGGGPGAAGWDHDADGTRVPPVRVRGTEQFPDPETPLVFDDAHPLERRPAGDLPPGPTSPPRASRSQLHALDAMNHRGRRVTTLVLAILVVAVFVALAVVGRHHGGKGSATATTDHPATTRAHHGTSGHGSGHPTTTTTSTSTTTTLPTRLTPTVDSAAAAHYSVPSAPFTLTIAATSASWISVTSVATGASVWAGLVPAGGHQAVNGTGSLDVDVGAPGITLTVNHIPVVLPTPFHTPSTLSFVVAGGTAATGPASSTSTTTAPSASAASTTTPPGT